MLCGVMLVKTSWWRHTGSGDTLRERKKAQEDREEKNNQCF